MKPQQGMPYKAQDYSYHEDMLHSLGTLLNFYVQRHAKALVVRFDIRYPQHFSGVSTNSDISRCMAYVVKKYKRQGYDPYYMWVIEQNKSEHPHYHCVLFLDAHKVRSFSHVFETVESTWARTLGMPVSGCIDHCLSATDPDYNGRIIRRDAGQQAYADRQQEVFDQISYLAKRYSKLTGQDSIRNFGMSRIPQPPVDPSTLNLFGD